MESLKCMYADDLTIAYQYGYTNRKSRQADHNINTWALILFYPLEIGVPYHTTQLQTNIINLAKLFYSNTNLPSSAKAELTN